MTTLSTHVLDTVAGRPAAGVAVRLRSGERLLFDGATDADGRCAAIGVGAGRYRLEFGVGDYFCGRGLMPGEPRFLDWVAVEFGVAGGEAHYHVPLLVAPHGYSTYRGS